MAAPRTNAGPAPGFWFDEAAADAAVRFFPDFLKLTEGEWFDRAFTLAKWQADHIVRPFFGWKRDSDHTRRYRRCIVWVARKNGKSELAAGVSHLALMADGEMGAQVFSIATSKDQARIVFKKASDMLTLSPDLQPHLMAFTTSIYCPETGGTFKPLAGIPKGKHGLSASGIIGDELHEWNSDRLYQFVHQSSAARRQPIEFLISTAGEKTGFGFETWQMCESILDGTIEDPETLVVIWQADAERDRKDPNYWKTEQAARDANPNYGISPKAEYLAAERKRAERLPRLENDYKRYHLNLWVEQATRWLPMDAWSDCGQPLELRAELRAAAEEDRPVKDHVFSQLLGADENDRWRYLPQAMTGRAAFAGLDLSSTTDLTALVWVFAPLVEGGVWTMVPRFFCPAVGVAMRSRKDKVPYEHWVKVGALTATPGNAVDYAYVKRQLYEDAERFKCGAIAVDRWNATQITIELNQQGLTAKLFGQGFASMSAPAKELEKLLLSRSLDHGGHPVLTWNARNAAVEKDAADNIKPSKAKSTERIDGIVAGVMGIGAHNETEPEPDLMGFIQNPVFA